MLHSCTKTGNKVDLERVGSVSEHRELEWTASGVRLVLIQFWSRCWAVAEQCQSRCRADQACRTRMPKVEIKWI